MAKRAALKRPGLSPNMVLAAAAKLADENGFEQLSLAELANHFRIKPPSLYNHIESLDALKRGLAMMALKELSDSLGKAAIGKARDDAVRAVSPAAYRDFVKRHPGAISGHSAGGRCERSGNESRER